MKEGPFRDSTINLAQTRLVSTFLSRMGDQTGYLVRIYPVVVGEGVLTLPREGLDIGRDADCGLVLVDADVSRRHARIDLRSGGYVIRDLDSTNGTYINNRKQREAALQPGDHVRLGKVIFKFLRGDDVEKQYHEAVYSMMITDGLTGIPNKRYFQEALKRELARSQRHKRPLSAAVLDVDFFKKINDKHGHLAGDAVLREICARIKTTIRGDEVFARVGGEEFIVLMPETSLKEAHGCAERIRKLVADAPVEVEKGSIPVTISIGLAHTDGETGTTAEELIGRADKKLYEAKNGGRNRVVG
ncbi:MAG TPA: GGDEF domain-containing protein [Planctomycetota bacterium]